MIRQVSFSLTILLCVLMNAGRADDSASELRVFYTGHSFHMFVPPRIALYTKAADVKEYREAGKQSIGGSRVQQHWDRPDEMNMAKKALESGKVDVFTMAPNVKMPDEGIDRFAELGLKHNPKMRFLVQESWVPGDYLEKRVANNAMRDETDLKKLRADQEKWRGQMEEQAKAINEKAKREAVFIVPVGDAVVKLREMIVAGKVPGIMKHSELFTDPIGHGKPPIIILTSYCNYACITGRNPVDLTAKEPGLSEELNTLLKKIAWETVTSYPMSGVKAKK
jgi:hypothetical protein